MSTFTITVMRIISLSCMYFSVCCKYIFILTVLCITPSFTGIIMVGLYVSIVTKQTFV